MCTAVLISWDPTTTPNSPHLGSNTRALLPVSQDRRHLFLASELTSLKTLHSLFALHKQLQDSVFHQFVHLFQPENILHRNGKIWFLSSAFFLYVNIELFVTMIDFLIRSWKKEIHYSPEQQTFLFLHKTKISGKKVMESQFNFLRSSQFIFARGWNTIWCGKGLINDYPITYLILEF